MTEQRWTTKELVALRQQGDPLADPMIEEVFAAGGMPAIRAFNAFLQNFNAPIPDDVPASVRSYLEAPAPAPEWIDPAKLEQARGLFVIYALPTLLIFWTKSAAQCFAADNGSHTFYKQRVFNPTALRSFMVEITQLICDVMTEGGGLAIGEDGPKGQGVVALQKLRLHHAFVRFILKNDEKGEWIRPGESRSTSTTQRGSPPPSVSMTSKGSTFSESCSTRVIAKRRARCGR